VWTSAGVTAGIDLALALVADDHGARAAGEVARQLVVYLRRSGGQAQFSAVLAAQSSDHEPVRDVLTWLTDNLTADLSIPALAAQATLLVRGAEARPLRAVRTFWDAHSCAMALPLVGNDTAPQWAVCSISRMCDNWTLGRSLLTSNCGVALRRQKRAGHVSGRLGRSGWD